jgi:hypothetical protein
MTTLPVLANGFQVRVRKACRSVVVPGLALGVLTACGGLTNNSTTTAPVISAITPTAMTVLNNVVVAGSGFTNTSAININGVNVTTWVVNADTQITLQVPSGAITGPIQVTTSAGTVASSTFTVIPQITGFTPTSGPVGTVVTITGSGFVGATSDSFGTETYSQYLPQILSANEIQVPVDSSATTGPVKVVASGVMASSDATIFTVTAQ